MTSWVWVSGDFALPHQDYTSVSLVFPFRYCLSPIGLGISVSVLSSLDTFAGGVPFETLLTLNYYLTLAYNLINCHLWNTRDRLFPWRYLIVHLSPSLFLHPKQEVRVFIFIFRVFSSQRRALWITLQTWERGEWLNWITLLLHNGSVDIHIFRDYTLSMLRCSTSHSHRIQYFQVWISSYVFLLSGIPHGDTFFI